MPTSPSNSKLVVEEGTIKPDRSFSYPKGRVIHSADETATAKRTETYRYKNGVLTAKNGIPVDGHSIDDLNEAETYPLTDECY
jgi:hypothetical protein